VSPDLAFALSLADDADAITLARFRAADLRVDTKPDLTPVSEADRAVETALRARIERERPGEPVLGEEEGGGDATGWVLDPIDGTRNYTRGIPVWATLIAYADQVAVVSAPALGRRWWAERGQGAYADGQRIHVSAIDRLEDTTLLTARSDPFFLRLVRKTRRLA
jgi:histidinol-phosphatase